MEDEDSCTMRLMISTGMTLESEKERSRILDEVGEGGSWGGGSEGGSGFELSSVVCASPSAGLAAENNFLARVPKELDTKPL